VERFNERLGRRIEGFDGESMAILRRHHWPGNVRELENLIMRLVALRPGELVGVDDLPSEYCLEHLGQLALSAANARARDEHSLYDLAMGHFERYLVRHVVDRCGGNKSEAARVLGISYSTLKAKFGKVQED
jgi:DNA-binding NtrC family response regulator